MDEKRNHKRTQVDRPVVYIELDAGGQNPFVGVGRALDVSKTGLMIESTEPVSANKLKIIASACGEVSPRVDARLVYSMPYAPGKYRSGILFAGPDEQVLTFVTDMIPTHSQENNHSFANPGLD